MDHLQQAKAALAELPYEDDARVPGLTQRAILSALIAIAERPAQELRPVEITTPGDDNSGACWQGRFHRWFTDADNEACAIIENDCGDVIVIELYKSQVRFLDRTPQPKPQPKGFGACPLCGAQHDPLERCA